MGCLFIEIVDFIRYTLECRFKTEKLNVARMSLL